MTDTMTLENEGNDCGFSVTADSGRHPVTCITNARFAVALAFTPALADR